LLKGHFVVYGIAAGRTIESRDDRYVLWDDSHRHPADLIVEDSVIVEIKPVEVLAGFTKSSV